MARAVAFVLKGYPRLSETFIAQELVALEEAGLDFDIWSLRFPTDKKTHPLHDRLKAKIRYLPEYLRDDPRRVASAMGPPSICPVLMPQQAPLPRISNATIPQTVVVVGDKPV